MEEEGAQTRQLHVIHAVDCGPTRARAIVKQKAAVVQVVISLYNNKNRMEAKAYAFHPDQNDTDTQVAPDRNLMERKRMHFTRIKNDTDTQVAPDRNRMERKRMHFTRIKMIRIRE